ncbi:MAG: PTS sugar transporter subunit IIA [Candidatus Omnitrophica bacterium]|nr:PTS sugar transporter subunit IIA [Candidatus Omnitrophota bacterium]
MNILDYLDEDSVALNIRPKSKKTIISSVLDFLIEKNKIDKDDKKHVLKSIIQREDMGSTAIGGGVAFPHARLDSVKDVLICVAISPEGVDFDSLDQEPVFVIALLLSNQKEAGLHLKMLAFLARMLRDKYLLQKLKSAKSSQEVLTILKNQQQAIF